MNYNRLHWFQASSPHHKNECFMLSVTFNSISSTNIPRVFTKEITTTTKSLCYIKPCVHKYIPSYKHTEKKSQGTHAILLITMIKTFLKKLLETPCTNTSFPSAAVRIMLQYQAKPDLNQYSHIIIKMLIFLATACNSEKLSPRQTLKSPDRH